MKRKRTQDTLEYIPDFMFPIKQQIKQELKQELQQELKQEIKQEIYVMINQLTDLFVVKNKKTIH